MGDFYFLRRKGFAWIDTRTHEALLDASAFLETTERRHGLKVTCIEEVAYRMGYIDSVQIEKLARPLRENRYGQFLFDMLQYGIRGSLKPNNSF